MSEETTKAGGILTAVILAVGIAIGLGGGWMLWRPKAAPVETKAPETRQADGSLELARTPNPATKPAQQIPKGAKVERVMQVTVQPKPLEPLPATPTPGSGPAAVPQAPEPGPIRVDLSLVRMPDLTRRVIASSPDGTVVGGVDIPVEPVKPVPKLMKWAAGGSWNPADHTYGAWVDRDAAFLRLGAEVNQVRAAITAGGATSYELRVRVGIRF